MDQAQCQSVFEIDTKATCLFCLSSNCVPLNDRTKADLTTATAFKMLFRYLNIDIRKVAIISSSGALLLDSSTNLAVSLCDACFFLVDEFLELFQDIERVRLQLERCTWKLQDSIGKGIEDEDRVREYQRRVQNNTEEEDVTHARFVEELRKETAKKCRGILSSSFPKIRLRKGGFPKLEEIEESKFRMTSMTPTFTKNVSLKKDICDKGVTRRPIVAKHHHHDRNKRTGNKIQGHHVDGTPEKCFYCAKYFTELRAHQLMVHPVKMFSPGLPPGVSDQDVKVAVDTIINASGKSGGKGFDEGIRKSCPVCGEVSVLAGKVSKLRLHILRSHQDQVCQSIQDQRQQQVVTVTPEKIPGDIADKRKCNIPCDICGKRFPSKITMKRHKYRSHKTGTGSFKCDFCDKTFLLDQTLQRHLRVVHLKAPVPVENSNSPTWACDYCDKVYPQRKSLRKHVPFKHAMQLYASRIPSGISEPAFESSVAAIVEKIMPVGKCNKARQKRPCLFCGKSLRCSDMHLRIHIVQNHLEEVVRSAEEASVTVTTDTADSMTSPVISCKTECPPSPPVIQMKCEVDEVTSFKFEEDDDEEHSLTNEDPLDI